MQDIYKSSIQTTKKIKEKTMEKRQEILKNAGQ